MKIIFSILFLIMFSYVSFSQTSTYYKDSYLNKKCKKEKAKYKKIEKIDEDGISSVYVYLLGREEHLLNESYYLNDKAVGNWKEYDINGKIIEERNFDLLKYDLKLPEDVYSPEPSDTIGFRFAEYGESIEELFRFLGQNINYPAEAKDKRLSGKVYINLVIDEEGNAYPYCIIEGVDPILDYEAWRVLSIMPKWKPATLNGLAVKSAYALPINFILK